LDALEALQEHSEDEVYLLCAKIIKTFFPNNDDDDDEDEDEKEDGYGLNFGDFGSGCGGEAWGLDPLTNISIDTSSSIVSSSSSFREQALPPPTMFPSSSLSSSASPSSSSLSSSSIRHHMPRLQQPDPSVSFQGVNFDFSGK
jgi:hypothetical protein